MNDRVCKKCGKIFAPKSKYETLCPECRAAQKKASVLGDRVCIDCGKTFVGGPRAWRCPSCRAAATRERQNKYQRHGFERHLGDTDTCIRCGKQYVITNGMQHYCPDCAKEAVAEKDRKKGLEYAREHPQDAEDKRTVRICVVCGKQFSSPSKEVTCSPECNKKLLRFFDWRGDYKRGRRKTPPPMKYKITSKKKTED